jgi:beta-lactamase superfamily II metal-dependent hydrolase
MSNPLEIYIFDVGLGQSIFIHPATSPEYGMFVDCADAADDSHPIDFLIKNQKIPSNGSMYALSNLTVTNYDQDHFSGLPYIEKVASIATVRLAKNLSSAEIKAEKEETGFVTDALESLCHLKDTYTSSALNYNPPYDVFTYSLSFDDLDESQRTTNNLSQLVFVKYQGSVICISGDLEVAAWDKIIKKYPSVSEYLKATNVFIASHHGRENGYCSNVFTHCGKPDCIIISDKDIMHDTQDGMASKYCQHVPTGITFNGESRKVLTTRGDGNLLIQFNQDGSRTYGQFFTKEESVRAYGDFSSRVVSQGILGSILASQSKS